MNLEKILTDIRALSDQNPIDGELPENLRLLTIIAISNLSERQQKVMRLYYDDKKPQTLGAISKQLSLSTQTISRERGCALNSIRSDFCKTASCICFGSHAGAIAECIRNQQRYKDSDAQLNAIIRGIEQLLNSDVFKKRSRDTNFIENQLRAIMAGQDQTPNKAIFSESDSLVAYLNLPINASSEDIEVALKEYRSYHKLIGHCRSLSGSVKTIKILRSWGIKTYGHLLHDFCNDGKSATIRSEGGCPISNKVRLAFSNHLGERNITRFVEEKWALLR